MRLNGRKRIVAIGVFGALALGLFGGGAVAIAADTPLAPPLDATVFRGGPPDKHHPPVLRLLERDILAATGLTQAQLKAGHRAGQSIAQTILANGGDPAAVEAKVLAALKVKLDAAVATGKITPAQESTALTKAQARLDAFLDRLPKPSPKLPAKVVLATLNDAAKVIGISPADLRTAMKAGKSAAQVASDHGMSEAVLVSGVTADVDARIDAALAAGTIDAARADSLKDRVPAMVTKLVNRVPRGNASTT